MEEVAEKSVYEKLLAHVKTVGGGLVSIAHRPNVAAFHNRLWELEKTPEGSGARYGLVARQLVETPLKTG